MQAKWFIAYSHRLGLLLFANIIIIFQRVRRTEASMSTWHAAHVGLHLPIVQPLALSIL